MHTAFQDAYGALIYTFPIAAFRLSVKRRCDFTCTSLRANLQRLSSFEGRNAIQFETYLSYHVLRDLCLNGYAPEEHLETVSLDAPVGEG
jgi:hypothetical protein